MSTQHDSSGDDAIGANSTYDDETNNDICRCVTSMRGESNGTSWGSSLRPIDETSLNELSISPQTPSASYANAKLLSNSTRPDPIASHNRSVTPHTAALMSLFSKPPNAPLTPTTPNFDASDGNYFCDTPRTLNTSSMPKMPIISSQLPPPCFSEKANKTKQQRKTLERKENSSSTFSESVDNEMQCSWSQFSMEKAYIRQNTPVTENTSDSKTDSQRETLVGYNLNFSRQQAASKNMARMDGLHDRDNTLIAHNLTANQKKLSTIQSEDEESGFGHNNNECVYDESTPMMTMPSSYTHHNSNKTSKGSDALLQLFQPHNASIDQMSLKTQGYSTFAKSAGNNASGEITSTTYMTPIDEKNAIPPSRKKETFIQITEIWIQLKSTLSDYFRPQKLKTTLVGAFLFALYQLVFSFAEASAITRPSHPVSSSSALLAPMALMACVGSLITCPMFIAREFY